MDLDIQTPKYSVPIPSVINERIKNTKYIGIAPFAAYASKSFPIQKLKELLHEISVLKNVSVLLFGGGKKEKEILDSIANEYNGVYSMVNTITFKEELALISNLDVMIAMDSGNGHIAAMYDVPVVTIWGTTHPYLGFTPFRQPIENQILPDLKKFPLIPTSVYGKDYPKEYLQCFDTISIQQIIARVKQYISSYTIPK